MASICASCGQVNLDEARFCSACGHVIAAQAASVASASPTIFVGRQRELQALRAHLDGALAGVGSLVMLVGEAGIGKTSTALRQFMELNFAPTDDPQRKARILDQMASAPQHVVASAWEGMLAWDSATAAAACKVPEQVNAMIDRFLAITLSLSPAPVQAGAAS